MTVTLRPTIRQVAETAGVSRMTVSRVLSDGNHSVSEETRQRVLEVVRELEYVPVSQPMVQSRSIETRVIGLVFDGTPFEGMWGLPTFLGLRESAKKHNYDLLTLLRDMPEWMLGKEDLQFLDRRCDGFIFIVPVKRYKTMETLTNNQIPVVACYTSDVPKSVPTIEFDDFNAMQKMTNHLIENGHKNILHLTTVPRSSDLDNRQLGYETAMQIAGLKPITFRFDSKNDESIEKLFQLLKQHQITAINSVGDLLAFYFSDIALAKGIKIPQDISITGMDNLTESKQRGLTSIDVSFEEVGRLAFEAMMRIIHGGHHSIENSVLPFRIIERTSVRRLC